MAAASALAGAGVLATLEHTIPAEERPEQAMRVLRRAIDGAVALEGERGEADQLAAVLLENLRAAADPRSWTPTPGGVRRPSQARRGHATCKRCGVRSSHMLPVVASGVSLSSGSLCGMRNLPDDAAARREWLERWAAEQEANRSPTRPARAWVRRRLALARARVRFRSEQLAIRVFERGLDFEGHAFEPEHDHPDRLPYVPSPWWTLPRALRFLGVSDRDTFVDFGCGKGRVVHQAAKRPFRRVIGVEISPALAEIARTNLATRRHQHRCPNVEIVVADAKEFPVPDDLTIAYFWHPFTGETLEAVLRGIVDSIDRHPRRVRLIYLGPHGAGVLATGRFRLLKEQQNGTRRVARCPTAIFESL